MINIFNEVITYLRNPVLKEDTNRNSNYRIKKFLHLLILSLITGFFLSIPISLLDEFGIINMKNHELEKMMESFSPGFIFLLVVVLAPIIEEAIFRAPITLFTDPKIFKIAFYVIAILFGYIHITNYNLNTNVLLFSPILVLPQIVLGAYLSFIRIKFGFLWGVALHAFYNGLIMLVSYMGELF